MSTSLASILVNAAHRATYSRYINGKKHYGVDHQEFKREFVRQWIIFNSHPEKQSCPHNGSIFFLFYKNSSVTNIQYSELVALIRTHSKIKGAQRSLIFSSTTEYDAFLLNVWESYFGDVITHRSAVLEDAIKRAASAVASDYGSVIRSTVILDIHFTSALLHVPRSISVDVRAITCQSGYVHSSGSALYIRNINKSSVEDLIPILRTAAPKGAKLPIFLVPYADELFRIYETGVTSTRNGLDGVSLKLKKHFIGGQPVTQILAALAQDPDSSFVIPAGLKDFRSERKEVKARTDCAVWFLSDSSLEPNSRDIYVAGDKLYFICYKQFFLNDNPLLTFKERKPAWFASTTLPHSLSRAMINVCRPNLRAHTRRNPLRIIDPFAGTGTTLIDLGLLLPQAQIIGVDLDPLSPSYIEDNINFFCRESSQIESLRIVVNAVAVECEQMLERAPPRSFKDVDQEDSSAKFRYAYEIIEMVFNERWPARVRAREPSLKEVDIAAILEEGFSASIRKKLANVDRDTRLFFFLVWRAIVMNTYTIAKSGKEGIIQSIKNEFKRFSTELEDLYDKRTAKVYGGMGSFSLIQGLYSLSGTHHPDAFVALRENFHRTNAVEDVKASDHGLFAIGGTSALDVLRSKSRYFDLIIGDPPYGFNEGNAQSREMQRLYSDLIDSAIEALAEGGNLVISVPAFARNGKQVPFYQTKDGLIPQVLAAANRRNREIARIANSRPTSGIAVGPPYYWGSTATISRHVIQFVIR